jgi:hypothetical protein
MSYIKLPLRTNLDSNSSADINQLTENVDLAYSKAEEIDQNYQQEQSSTNDIDWTLGLRVALTISGNTTINFINPPEFPCHVQIRLTTSGSTPWTISFNQSIRWAYGLTYNQVTGVNGKVDFINLYFDGSEYFGQFLKGF